MLVGLYILMGMGLNLEVGPAGPFSISVLSPSLRGRRLHHRHTDCRQPSRARQLYRDPQVFHIGLPCLSLSWRRSSSGFCSAFPCSVCAVTTLQSRRWALARSCASASCNPDMARTAARGRSGDPANPEAQDRRLRAQADPCATLLSDPSRRRPSPPILPGVSRIRRLGRAWMAVRDDEDVAQALGINLVKVKLLAYGLGAAFAGLAGCRSSPSC